MANHSLRTPGEGETISSFQQPGGEKVQETGAMIWDGAKFVRHSYARARYGASPTPVLDSASEALESNQAGKLLRVLSFNWDIQTSATAGARYVGYEVTGPEGHTVVEALTPELKPSTLYGVCSFVGAPLSSATAVSASQSRTVLLPLFDFALPQGYKITYIAPFKQTGDTFPLFRTLYEYI
jgi:hypothetical protein